MSQVLRSLCSPNHRALVPGGPSPRCALWRLGCTRKVLLLRRGEGIKRVAEPRAGSDEGDMESGEESLVVMMALKSALSFGKSGLFWPPLHGVPELPRGGGGGIPKPAVTLGGPSPCQSVQACRAS